MILPLQKFESAHVQFLKRPILAGWLIQATRGGRAPCNSDDDNGDEFRNDNDVTSVQDNITKRRTVASNIPCN